MQNLFFFYDVEGVSGMFFVIIASDLILAVLI